MFDHDASQRIVLGVLLDAHPRLLGLDELEAQLDQSQRARFRRRIAPRERGRDIVAVARVATRNVTAVPEGLAAERELGHPNELASARPHAMSSLDRRTQHVQTKLPSSGGGETWSAGAGATHRVR